MRASIVPIVYGPDVEALLAVSDLPSSDLGGPGVVHLFGCRNGCELTGTVGVELYGPVALLRSLTVSEPLRHSGLGKALTEYAESWAGQHGVGKLYLLTTTASDFFANLGYEPTARLEAPAAIAQTTQFADLCPLSSAFMSKRLAINIASEGGACESSASGLRKIEEPECFHPK